MKKAIIPSDRAQEPSQILPIRDFHHRDFSSETKKKRLLREKEEQGLRIGIGLPVFNEESTLDGVLKMILGLKNQGLVDDIIVVDSQSTDRSRQIARSNRIKVVTDKEASQELDVELQKGKGFNLWASLHYLDKADIVAWMDTDLKYPKERFVLGTLGPLIENEDLVFVKGRYKRPEIDNKVTRYVAEPLLSMFFPELNDFIDPLCGKFAGRRMKLREIPFDPSYGTEVSMLVNMTLKHPNKVAQAYLGPLQNRVRDSIYYGIMSGEIIYSILHNAKKQGRVKFNGGLQRTLVQQVSQDGVEFLSAEYQIDHEELPSMKYIEQKLAQARRPAINRIQNYEPRKRK